MYVQTVPKQPPSGKVTDAWKQGNHIVHPLSTVRHAVLAKRERSGVK